MQSTHDLRTIPDDELLRRLGALLASSRRTEADLVVHLGEVDVRRLYAREAVPSMFAYCTERLHLSEAEACLRIAAARASREHPVVLEMLADGRLHLSGIARLAPHLTLENRDDRLRRATHRTKREIEELVAEIAPRPDVPASVRRLPAGRWVARPVGASRADLPGVSPAALGERTQRRDAPAAPPGWPQPTPSHPAGAQVDVDGVLELRPEQVDSGRLDATDASTPGFRCDAGLRWVACQPSRRASIEPLAPARYRVQFTASAELREKLERLKALMSSSVPDGDLAAIIDAAVTEKLERLEARRFGRTTSPRTSVSTTDTSPRTRRVPAAVKRAVHERDGGRCRYVDAQGHRCTARVQVEFHHRKPWGVGGDHSTGNVGLLCPVHNRYLAEIDYGRKAVGKGRRSRAAPNARPSRAP